MTNFPPRHRIGRDRAEQSRCNVIPIDELSDAILLEIFASYVDQSPLTIEAWQTLVHVSRRWRSIVFASPHRLNLRLVCTPEKNAIDMLDIWPAFPLVIKGYVSESRLDNIIAVLRRNGARVCQIDLDGLTKPQLDELSTVTLGRFPELKHLQLRGYYEVMSFDNKSFLGGSAPPRLQSLSLDHIPLLRLPKLLSSATQLVRLHLSGFPTSRSISPKALATALSSLSKLQSLDLTFRPPESRPQWTKRRPQPPPTRFALPALTRFCYLGVHKYLEDLVSRIDAPQLNESNVSFSEDKELGEEIRLDASQFAQFIDRVPGLKAHNEAHVELGDHDAAIRIPLLSPGPSSPSREHTELIVDIADGEADWRLSSLVAVCASLSPILSTVENLYIEENEYWKQVFYYYLERWRLLDVFGPFTAVKNLHLPGASTRDVMQVIVDLGARALLPKLENIFLDSTEVSEEVLLAIGLFDSARRLSHQPVTLFISDGDWALNKFTKV